MTASLDKRTRSLSALGRRLRRMLVVAASLLLLSSRPAGAGEPPRASAPQPSAENAARAAQRYDEGKRLLDEGKPAEAIIALDASLAFLPSANTELLRAHALRRL